MRKLLTFTVLLLFFVSCKESTKKDSSRTETTYSFVDKELKLISAEELMSQGPPTSVEKVYYEDGTVTTLKDIMPGLISRKLQPKMYIDKDGNYKTLVVVGEKPIKNEANKPKELKIEYKNIPENLKNKGISYGNPNSDIIIINTQGGPMPQLATTQFEDIFFKQGKLDYDKVLAINVHQVQTLHPERFSKDEVTFQQAIEYQKETTKILYDLVKYFKSQNKTVYVTGLSIGAFAGVDLLATHGDIADGYLFMVGRLNMTDKVWNIFSEGAFTGFKNDGVTVLDKQETDVNLQKNMAKLAAGFGHKRYMKLLKDIPLEKVIYVHGTKDENVGRLTQEEIDFLKSKKVNAIQKDGGHEIMITYIEESLNLLLKK